MTIVELSYYLKALIAILIASMGFSTPALSDIRIEELANGDSGYTFEVVAGIASPVILTAAEDNLVRLWNLGASKEMVGFRGHTDWVNTLALSSDGELAASASYDQTVRIWNMSSGVQVQVLPFRDDQAYDVALNPTATHVAATTDTGVHLWDIATGELLRTLSTCGRHHPTTVSFSPDGRMIVAGTKHSDFMSLTNAGRSYLWSVDQVEPVAWFNVQEDEILSTAFTPDGDSVLTASADGTIVLWRAQTGAEIGRLEPLSGVAEGASFSRDGSRILVSETTRRFSVWRASTFERMMAFDFDQHIEAIAFGADGGSVVFSAADGTIRGLSLETAQ